VSHRFSSVPVIFFADNRVTVPTVGMGKVITVAYPAYFTVLTSPSVLSRCRWYPGVRRWFSFFLATYVCDWEF